MNYMYILTIYKNCIKTYTLCIIIRKNVIQKSVFYTFTSIYKEA